MSAQNITNIIDCRVCHSELSDDNWRPYDCKNNNRICSSCAKKRAVKFLPKNQEERDKANARERVFKQVGRLALKIETMMAYGDGVCAKCGEDGTLFLTLDHINNNGKFDRQNKLVGVEFYAYLKKLGFPGRDTQLRVLCHCCNALDEIEYRKTEDRLGNEKRNVIREVFVKQKYELSEDIRNKIKEQALDLYYRLNPDITVEYNDYRNGKESPKALLTNEQATEIREIYRTQNISHKEIGLKYGVGKEVIGQITRRTTHKNAK